MTKGHQKRSVPGAPCRDCIRSGLASVLPPLQRDPHLNPTLMWAIPGALGVHFVWCAARRAWLRVASKGPAAASGDPRTSASVAIRPGGGAVVTPGVVGQAKVEAILREAESWIGTPYGKSDRYPQQKGAEGTGDCSGSTEAIYRAEGLPIRRGASSMSGAEAISNSPDLIERACFQPAMSGDILLLGTGRYGSLSCRYLVGRRQV